jgi:DNA-directed RNA polymerase subunit alpha
MDIKIEFGVKKDKIKADYGRFVISPLPAGFGVTVGNALRRVLLGAMPGTAITQVKVEGANHPFATLRGVKEDLIDILLRIKQIRIKSSSEKPVKGKIEKRGPGEVIAGDIKFPPGVKVQNPKLVLATLADKKSKFAAEFTVEKGSGYSLAEDHKTGRMGLIPVDAIFSPVVKANYGVKATRLGKKSNFDELVLEIWTDKSASPQEVLKTASQVLSDVFSNIVRLKAHSANKNVREKEINHDLDLLVEELDLPLRLVNALKKAGYKKVKNFIGVKRSEIRGIKNVGDKSIGDLEKILRQKGISLED